MSIVDEKIPVVKMETHEIKDNVVSTVFWPVTKAGESKEYVLGTWSSEYKKCGGDGVVAGAKSMVTSSLVITSDVLNWLSSFLAAKKADAEAVVKEKTQN